MEEVVMVMEEVVMVMVVWMCKCIVG